ETMTVPGPGIVLVCTDGLWNYYETPASLRELIAAGPPGEGVLETARRLVDAALEAGGHDNITVAMKSLGAPSWAAVAEARATEPEGEAGATGAEGDARMTEPEAPSGAEAPPETEVSAGIEAAPGAEAPPEIETDESEE
ncbi:MAG TPA: hypothetical protein VGA71_17175, partial [Actinomycetota bacterium]